MAAGPSTSTSRPKSSFSLLVSGQIETADFPTVNNLYCKYFYVYGADWRQVSGIEEGISCTCERGAHTDNIVFNTPLEATFSSTNPFRWPQIVLSCYGLDRFGNDVIRGYGAVHLPTVPGRAARKVAMFLPEASTAIQKLLGYVTGRRAEFVDPRIVAMSEGREVTRVRTQGFVTLSFNTVLKDIKKFGYDVQPLTISRISEFPLPQFEYAPPPEPLTSPPPPISQEETVTELRVEETPQPTMDVEDLQEERTRSPELSATQQTIHRIDEVDEERSEVSAID
ncbi:B9 protein [Aphelenchoides avenae]|nr:B9 protein [Aphelenchus avenae]